MSKQKITIEGRSGGKQYAIDLEQQQEYETRQMVFTTHFSLNIPVAPLDNNDNARLKFFGTRSEYDKAYAKYYESDSHGKIIGSHSIPLEDYTTPEVTVTVNTETYLEFLKRRLDSGKLSLEDSRIYRKAYIKECNLNRGYYIKLPIPENETYEEAIKRQLKEMNLNPKPRPRFTKSRRSNRYS